MFATYRHGKPPASFPRPWYRHKYSSTSLTQASKCVDTIDVHGAATTDPLSAAPSEGQRRINLVLDANQGIQHHGTGLVQVEGVALHARLRGRLVGIPAVYVERLGPGLGVDIRLDDGRSLAGRDGTSRRVRGECSYGHRAAESWSAGGREEAGGGAEGGHRGSRE